MFLIRRMSKKLLDLIPLLSRLLSKLSGLNRRRNYNILVKQGHGVPVKAITYVPIRNITKGPKYHWFGYYDKLEFDPTDRFVLSMKVDFENRSPRPSDIIKVGMVDLQSNDKWIELGESRAWNWQQGCMLQFRPGSKTEIMWNDREGNHFVCHILDIETQEKRTLPFPIYCVSSDGQTAMSLDFERIQHTTVGGRPVGYGYAGVPNPSRNVNAPRNSGIYKLNLETGTREKVISFAEIAKIPQPNEDFSQAKHYFNHLLFNTDGSRFAFLHRWIYPDSPCQKTRMFTATPEGDNVRLIDNSGSTSHYIWRDQTTILAWSSRPIHGKGFYIFEDVESQEPQIVGRGVMILNGHASYLPGNRWILNDNYACNDRNRLQHVYLYNGASGEKAPLGSFYSSYDGEWRVDTHPRLSRDGKSVVIDSPHGGNGRQLYLLDIKAIIGEQDMIQESLDTPRERS